jgi:alkylation response protein AidB-like acyl-CoA dehydrogenase
MEIAAPEKQFSISFDGVEVGRDRLVGNRVFALRDLFQGLDPERMIAAATSTGIGRYALGKAAAYARDREVWGRSIGTHQGLSHPLANAYVQVELARLMWQKAAWSYDQHDGSEETAELANIAKYASAEAGLTALDQAIQIHGGNGLSSDYGLADLWGTARLLRTAPVSREMILNFVAQHSLGLERSY